MNTGDRIQRLRKENNMTQENLADYVNVSRQSISKWEANLAYPETDKLIKLAELFNVSVDYLLRGTENIDNNNLFSLKSRYHYEYKSKRMIKGIPLVHINIGYGLYKAKGIIAIGTMSKGFISLGLLSMGLFSFGLFSLGLISLGVFVLGILGIGSISCGIISIGAIAVGIFTIGAVSIGYFSVGALSVAKYVAIGDRAFADIAIGKSYAEGSIYQSDTSIYNRNEVIDIINDNVHKIWSLFIELIKLFL